MQATLLARMQNAAHDAGRDLAAVWAEAAREWLAQRECQDDWPQPPAPAAALAIPLRRHDWSGIDAVLADLRRPGSGMAASPATGGTTFVRPAA